ncbi:MAG: hypothetical protein V7752_06695 [Halopseudomonas sp.]
MTGIRYFFGALACYLALPALADSSSPRLAAYYDDFMALCGDQVYEWSGTGAPTKSKSGIKRVGVGDINRYGLTEQGELLVWSDDPTKASVVLDQVRSFDAGRSGLLIIRQDRSLWHVNAESFLGFGEKITEKPVQIAEHILQASVGDGANYYVTQQGALFVKGKAHRGQYGDGKLTTTEGYVETAEDVDQVVSHTGHALILKKDGSVWGTGGNIYGPLSSHGYGDKAIRWGHIAEGVIAIATGSSHSLAIQNDGSLWIWGRNEGLKPKKVMASVSAVAAGKYSSIALSKGVLWQWETGSQPKHIMKCE